MRLPAALAVLLCAAGVSAGPATDTAKAQEKLNELKQLVDAGAVAPARLQDALAALDDARDNEILQRTLFGNVTAQDLTEDQSREMVAAAQRRYDRQQKVLEARRKLVDAGVIARAELAPFQEELASRELTLNLAKSRAQLFEDIAESARREAELAQQAATLRERASSGAVMARFDGDGQISPGDIQRIEVAFQAHFHKPLPVSAFGDTSVHRALGFDHRGRVDVALTPDQEEGVWLRNFLEQNDIPYYAFRAAIPGKATGAHIHIGPSSTRLRAAD
jgi:hypothetical protein